MNNYKAVIEYDGTYYHGFQKQPGNVRTIEGELTKILRQVSGEKIYLGYAGRTDLGVHAKYQVLNFKTRKDLNLYNLKWSLNSMLPDDIVISEMKKVENSFDPRWDAKWRQYTYQVVNSNWQSVFLNRYSICITKKLDIGLMRKAARLLTGQKDFASFCNPECLVENINTVRKLFKFTITKNRDNNDLIIFQIAANSFLYNMVRIIIGTLLEVGSGDRNLYSINETLKGRDRNLSGKIAPAKGLILTRVEY